jgi:hypothetical protein
VDAWTFLDAKKMHKEKYRESYLKRIDYFSSKRNDNSRYDDLPF